MQAAAIRRQISTQSFRLTGMCVHTLQCVPDQGWGNWGSCLLVTLDVVDWEKMGPFHFLNSTSLRSSLLSVARRLIH